MTRHPSPPRRRSPVRAVLARSSRKDWGRLHPDTRRFVRRAYRRLRARRTEQEARLLCELMVLAGRWEASASRWEAMAASTRPVGEGSR